MHVSNVHVTRARLDGKVKSVTRVGGKHYPIYFLKKRVGSDSEAIRKNARVIIELEDNQGRPFIYHLVCGYLARRAKPYVKVGDIIKEGQKMGVISFGSLVKVTLPGNKYKLVAKISDNVIGGQTIICERTDE
jgi:phosphatidylserine decarboxylase